MDLKKIIKKIILEDEIAKTASIKGGDSDISLARAEYLTNKAMQNLSDLGVYGAKGYVESLGIFTEDLITKSGSFKLSFTTKDGKTISGVANYDKNFSKLFNTISLFFISGKLKIIIVFEKNSINRKFLGLEKKEIMVKGIQEGEIFPVLMFSEKDIKGKTGDQIKNISKKVSKIKINKIGLRNIGNKDTDDVELTTDNFVKVSGQIKLPDDIKNIFDATTLSKIKNYLNKGIFYARLSKQTKNTLILSDSPNQNNNAEYVVLKSKDNFDSTDPKSWGNKTVNVGKNAMGNDDFSTSFKGTIGQLKVIK
jgi:hypothetical protein